MSKIELDDQILDHPKFVRAVKLAGADAVFLWMGLRSYCSKLLTDGFIPSDMVDEVRGPRDQKRRKAALEALRTVNLLEDADGGYRLHDYLDHASSRDQIMAWRKANADRKAKSRGVSQRDSHRDGKRDTGVTPTVTDGVTTSGVPAPSPSPSQTQSSSLDLIPPNPPMGTGTDAAAEYERHPDSEQPEAESGCHAVGSIRHPSAHPEPPRPKPPSAVNVVPPPTRRDRVRTEWSEMPIQELARRCRENPHDAAMAGPECRPEVVQVQRAWCEAVGLPVRPLGSLSPKNGALQAILAALEAHSLPDVLRACDQAKRDDWAQGRAKNRDGTDGKKCRLEWMSLNVIRRLLDAADEASPENESLAVRRVKAMLAAEKQREAGAV